MKLLRVMLVLTIVSLVLPLYAQTLTGLARQERERKKALESKTVFTNDSITSTGGVVAITAPVTNGTATAAPSVPAAPAVQAAPKGPVDNKGRDEQYWRTAFDKARQEVKRAQNMVQLTERKVTELSSQLLREGVYSREVEIRAEIDKTKKEQESARQQLALSQQKVRDLEEELRRSNGLPGWAR